MRCGRQANAKGHRRISSALPSNDVAARGEGTPAGEAVLTVTGVTTGTSVPVTVTVEKADSVTTATGTVLISESDTNVRA